MVFMAFQVLHNRMWLLIMSTPFKPCINLCAWRSLDHAVRFSLLFVLVMIYHPDHQRFLEPEIIAILSWIPCLLIVIFQAALVGSSLLSAAESIFLAVFLLRSSFSIPDCRLLLSSQSFANGCLLNNVFVPFPSAESILTDLIPRSPSPIKSRD